MTNMNMNLPKNIPIVARHPLDKWRGAIHVKGAKRTPLTTLTHINFQKRLYILPMQLEIITQTRKNLKPSRVTQVLKSRSTSASRVY